MQISRSKKDVQRVVITAVLPGATFIYKGKYYIRSPDKNRATNLVTGKYEQIDMQALVTMRKMKVVLL